MPPAGSRNGLRPPPPARQAPHPACEGDEPIDWREGSTPGRSVVVARPPPQPTQEFAAPEPRITHAGKLGDMLFEFGSIPSRAGSLAVRWSMERRADLDSHPPFAHADFPGSCRQS